MVIVDVICQLSALFELLSAVTRDERIGRVKDCMFEDVVGPKRIFVYSHEGALIAVVLLPILFAHVTSHVVDHVIFKSRCIAAGIAEEVFQLEVNSFDVFLEAPLIFGEVTAKSAHRFFAVIVNPHMLSLFCYSCKSLVATLYWTRSFQRHDEFFLCFLDFRRDSFASSEGSSSF